MLLQKIAEGLIGQFLQGGTPVPAQQVQCLPSLFVKSHALAPFAVRHGVAPPLNNRAVSFRSGDVGYDSRPTHFGGPMISELAGWTILVVDQPLIALDVAAVLRDAGAK